jgi:hypothetical protein
MSQHYPRPPVKGPVIIPNCVQVSVFWTYSGQSVANVYHGNYTGVPLVSTVANTIYQALVAAPSTTAWLAKLHTSIFLMGVEVKDLRAANNPTYESATGAGHPGVSAGGQTSAATALVISLRTAKSGKGFFGRTYLPGITQDNMLDARHWDNTKLEALSNAYVTGIQTAMQASGFAMCVAQRALAANADPNAPPAQKVARAANADNIVTGIKWTDNRVDTQRRRLGR